MAGPPARDSPPRQKPAGVDVKSTELIPRGTPLPEVGASTAVDDAVFKLKAGDTSGPIATENAVVVAQVKERQEMDPAALTNGRDGVRDELVQQRRQEFFAAYMVRAKGKLKILYNEDTIKTLMGT